jgi:hypothetical protein
MLDATNQNLQEEKNEEIPVKPPQVEGSASPEKQEESLQKDLKLEEKFDKSNDPQEVRDTVSEDTKSELNQVEEIAPKDTIRELKQAETTVSIEVEKEVLTKTNTKEEVTQVSEVETVESEIPEKSIPEPKFDLAALDLETLVKELGNITQNSNVAIIKSNVEEIKKVFDEKFGVLLAEKKAQFIAEGGESIDFYFSSPLKVTFNEMMENYKAKRKAHYDALDVQLKENLNKRIAAIDALKEIIDKADAKTMYNDFKQLQLTWKAIGPVPRTKYNTTWRNYHHHVERFYDLLHLNKDLRELDFKHNLEEKLKIVARAEHLSEQADLESAFKELQELHKKWKEEIGPVSKEFSEEIWQKFSVATKKIHSKRDAFFEGQKTQYEENLKLKVSVIETLEVYDTSKNKTHSDWQRSIKEFEAVRETFFKIGKVNRQKSQQIWERLKGTTKNFNHAKNAFYKELNHSQQENLQKKLALVALASSLKDSEEHQHASSEMKRIQAEWKTIGHVPRKFSDKIWKEFKGACNHYFDRVHKIQDSGSVEEQEALATKKEFLQQIKGVYGNSDIAIEEVKAYLKTWKNIGRVPRKEKAIEVEFNKAIEILFEQLDVSGDELALMKYKIKMDALSLDNPRKIEGEIQFVRKKVDEITKEIKQLENNISFISNATDDNPLVANVKDSIVKNSSTLIVWKQKLTFLRGLLS